MPYASNKGIKIYYEVEGQGPPLMLAHSFRRNLNRWRQIGFADALKNDYKLILFDARGHGKSDKPHDPAAYGNKMAEDVIAVLDDLRIDRTHYYGYSMGAGVGFKATASHPERFLSLVLGGIDPFPPEVPDNSPAFPADPEVFLKSLERMLERPLTPEERKAELANDFQALGACTNAWSEITSLSNRNLSLLSMTCLLYAGDIDPVYAGSKEAASHIPGAEFLSLPGLNHVTAAYGPKVLQKIKAFLERVSRI